MTTFKACNDQIGQVISKCIALSVCDSYFYPVVQTNAGVEELTIQKHDMLSMALKNIPYRDIYTEIDREKAYHMRMLDGALVQMSYRFDRQGLIEHRLAYLPAPDFEQFQNDPDIYLEDEMFAEVIQRSIMAVPIRFDFKRDPEPNHPSSHLTLGQYKNCRIPVSCPLTPYAFVDFLLRHFYNPAFRKFAKTEWEFATNMFGDCILDSDSKLAHLRMGSR